MSKISPLKKFSGQCEITFIDNYNQFIGTTLINLENQPLSAFVEAGRNELRIFYYSSYSIIYFSRDECKMTVRMLQWDWQERD